MEKLVPKLRFPEFNGNWDKKKIGDIGDVKMCKRIFSEETTPNGEIPFYKIGSFGKVADAFISRELFENYKNRFSYPKIGDILISASGTIGRTVVYNGEEAYYQDSNIVWVGNNNTLVSNEFFYYILQLVKFNTEGGTIQRLYNSILKSTKFNCPKELIEQQKIATFLTSVDERLTLLAQQKEKLELYKKGVMQQIFSQKLRFKDENGKEYPDWEEKKLGDLFNFLRGSSLSKNDLKLDGKNLCIHYGELFTIHNEEIKYILSRTDISGTLSKSGDILMPSSDVTPNGLATASAIFHENVIIGGDINILRPSKSLNSLYFSYYLNFSKKEIIKLVTGTTVKHIYNKDVKLLKLKVSKSLEEQQKIASFLSAIDVQIEGVNKKIAQTKTFKKGLLQQLFV